MYKDDGTPISSNSLNLNKSGKDFSDYEMERLKNLTSGSTELHLATVREIYFIDDPKNQLKTQVEYKIRIEYGPKNGLEYENVRSLNLHGGIVNFSEVIYYPKTQILKGNRDKDNVYMSDHDATQVVVGFIDGLGNRPFILGGWSNLNSETLSPKIADGVRKLEEFNGVRIETNKDGEYILTYHGGPRNTKTKVTSSASTAPTTFKIDKLGAWSIDDKENQKIKIDRSTKTIEISQYANVKPNETYGQKDSSVPGDIINQIKMDKTAKSVTIKAGKDKVIQTMDGTAESLTIEFSSGLKVTLQGNGDVATIETNAGPKVHIDGPANKVIIEAPHIELGEGATESVIKGDLFKAFFDAHIHPTGVGPSGPPTIPVPAIDLSTIVKTK